MTRIHKLDLIKHRFELLAAGDRSFDTRPVHADFQRGDIIVYRMMDDTGRYAEMDPQTRNSIRKSFRIEFVQQGGQDGIAPGWCVLGLRMVEEQTA